MPTRIERPPADRVRRQRQAPAVILSGVAAAMLLVAAAAYLWLDAAPPAGAVGGPFRLTDGGGRTVTDRDLRGKYLLVYFGYTACPDVCPTTLSQVALALERLGATADRIQPVFITLDPRRDTPAVVGRYVAAFGPRLLGLTGAPAEIAGVARAYHLAYAAPAAAGGDYRVDHQSVLYLMGPDGRFIATLPAGEPGDAMAADLAARLG